MAPLALIAACALAAATCHALPVKDAPNDLQDNQHNSTKISSHGFIFHDYVGKLDHDGNKIPGSIQDTKTLSSAHPPSSTGKPARKSSDRKNKHSKRGDPSNYVSTCGAQWVPLDDFSSGGVKYIGYTAAVKAFCEHITTDFLGNPTVVGPNAYAGTTISENIAGHRVGLDQGKEPSENGTPGHIEFEIHNKQSSSKYTPDRESCIYYLMRMAQPSSSCYGSDNDDSKGGTYQIGKNLISFHALPNYDN